MFSLSSLSKISLKAHLTCLVMIMLLSLGCETITHTTEMEKDLIETRLKIIQSKLDQQEFSQAQASIEPLLRKYPDNPSVMTMAGLIDMTLNNYDRAIDMMKKSHRLLSSPGSALNLSSAYIQTKQYDLAVKYLHQGIQLNKKKPYPHIARLYHNLGYIYELQHDYPQALAHYKKALYNSPSFTITLMLYSQLLKKTGNISESIKISKRYITACKTCFEPVNYLAQFYLKNGDIDVAKSLVKQFVKNNPNHQSSQRLLTSISSQQTLINRN